MSTRKPSVFIGSSSEGLPVARVVARLLKSDANVTLWTDRTAFNEVGAYFLDSLIAASAKFDFAILIFGADDVIESRGSMQKAPRDNVIFELGLFMSRLGRNHAFVIAPETWRVGLKILSDLMGLTLEEYKPLDQQTPPLSVAKQEKAFKPRLEEVCKRIAIKIRRLGPQSHPRGPKGITDIREPLEELVRNARALNVPIRIRNIALDMEVTWPLVREMLLSPQFVDNITWQSLMIDPTAESIRSVASDTVSTDLAASIESRIKDFCFQNATDLIKRNMQFEVKAYSEIPILHGFLFNDQTVFFSFCGMMDGKLVGSPNPYIRLDSPGHPSTDEAAAHFLTAFENWFEHRWKHSRSIWPY